MARPKKQLIEIKSIRLTIHTTASESEILKRKSKVHGMSISRYVRESALYSDDTRLPRLRYQSIHEIKRIGVNINQIAHHINSVVHNGGTINYQNIDKQLNEYLLLLRSTIKELRQL